MNEHVSKYEQRNQLVRKIERFALLVLIFLILPIFLICFIIYENSKTLNSLSILLSLTALLQLEVSGLFEYIRFFENELEKTYEESGCAPSNLVRPIYEFYNPEPTIRNFIKNNLYFNKRIGFYLLLIGGLLQLCITWFT